MDEKRNAKNIVKDMRIRYCFLKKKKNGKVLYKGERERERERDTEDQNVSDFVCFFKQKIEHRGLSHLQLSLLKSLFFLLITLTVFDLIMRQDQNVSYVGSIFVLWLRLSFLPVLTFIQFVK